MPALQARVLTRYATVSGSQSFLSKLKHWNINKLKFIYTGICFYVVYLGLLNAKIGGRLHETIHSASSQVPSTSS